VTQVVHYPDVSGYQAGMSLAGAPAAMAKATEGSSWTDPAYVGFRDQAARLGIPFSAYHWINTAAADAQAAHCFAVVGPNTPVMWDCEAAGATVGQILAVTAAYRRLGGRATTCYMPHWWWQSIGSPDLRPLAAAGLALVSSSYPAAGYSDTGPGWAPYGGVAPTIWQYTDKGPFGGRSVDFNAFRGTVDQLRSVFNGGGTSVAATNGLPFTDDTYALAEGITSAGNTHDQHLATYNLKAVEGRLNTRLDAIAASVGSVASLVLTDQQVATIGDHVAAALGSALADLAGAVAGLRTDVDRLVAAQRAAGEAVA
jgi:hypothetical protein